MVQSARMETNALFSAGASPWAGARVAFLGDSITDPAHIGCRENYWGVLAREIGIVPLVYGVNGAQWSGVPGQAGRLAAEQPGGVDAVFVFAGTNDFNSDVPLGRWYEESDAEVLRSRGPTRVRRRRFDFDPATLRGRVNAAMKDLQERWPEAPKFLLTPIHRGFAQFAADNVQVVKEAGDVWAATVVDLFSDSGLFPLLPSHARFFNPAGTDRLHPADPGHVRIARAIERRLGFPARP